MNILLYLSVTIPLLVFNHAAVVTTNSNDLLIHSEKLVSSRVLEPGLANRKYTGVDQDDGDELRVAKNCFYNDGSSSEVSSGMCSSESNRTGVRAVRSSDDVQKCENIGELPLEDQCSYVKLWCLDSENTPGVFPYLKWYYCGFGGPAESLPPSDGSGSTPTTYRWIGMLFLSLLLCFLFIFLGTAASDYFCPNLSTLADALSMPEDVAGVTFLAFGNSAPDLFSSLVAIHATGNIGMALGELIGAGLFVGGLVVGVIALSGRNHNHDDSQHHQSGQVVRVDRMVFLRDTLFFLASILILGFMLVQRKMYWWQGLLMLILYAIYVALVIYMGWKKSRKSNGLEFYKTSKYSRSNLNDNNVDMARTLVSNQELGRKWSFQSCPEERESNISDKLRSASFRSHDPRAMEPRNSYRRKYTDSVIRNRLFRYMKHQRQNSLVSSIEFSESLRNSSLSGDEESSEEKYGPSAIFSTHNTRQKGDRDFDDFEPLLPLAVNGQDHSDSIDEVVHSPVVVKLHNRHMELHRFRLYENSFISGVAFDLRQTGHTFARHLFPIYWSWNEMSGLSRVMAIINVPAVFVMGLTVPVIGSSNNDESGLVVESSNASSSIEFDSKLPLVLDQDVLTSGDDDDDDDDDDNYTNHTHKNSQKLNDYKLSDQTRLLIDHAESLSSQTSSNSNSKSHPKKRHVNWYHRWILILQMFLSPLFILFCLEGINFHLKLSESLFLPAWIIAVLVGSCLAIVVYLKTCPPDLDGYEIARMPFHHPFYSFIGFAVGVFWVYFIAKEVVSLLKALGKILELADAILGITVFAFGNSIGDLISNYTLAKMGYAKMSISASFAGPMLNLLITLGVSGLMDIGKPPQVFPLNTNILFTYVGLLAMLIFDMIFIPLSNYKVGKRYGYGMVLFYTAIILATVLFDLTGNEIPGLDPNEG